MRERIEIAMTGDPDIKALSRHSGEANCHSFPQPISRLCGPERVVAPALFIRGDMYLFIARRETGLVHNLVANASGDEQVHIFH